MTTDLGVLSGPYGLVAIPDRATMDRAYSYAREVLPRGTEFVLEQPHVPHMTLYHGAMTDIPVQGLAALRDRAEGLLARRTFVLEAVVVAGGKFAFWNLNDDSRTNAALVRAHETALEMAAHLNPAAKAKALGDEGLTLTDGERDNCMNFGHPWVKDLYKPHITLGYNTEGLPAEAFLGVALRWAMTIERVAAVEIGHPGIIKRELELPVSARPVHPLA